MPFKSKSQMKKCFAMKARGEAKGWNCAEWAKETPNRKSLPQKAKAGRPRKSRGLLH